MVKKLIKNSLKYLGYDIKGLKGSKYSAEYLSKLCDPGTVFDVGVGHGTYSLYNAFPNSHFVLIEPLNIYESSISKISDRYDCEVYSKAVSDHEGRKKIRVSREHPQRSSFEDKKEIIKIDETEKEKVVDVTTLDYIYEDIEYAEKPILLKLDIEGHELKALKGGKRLISNANFIITEVSIAQRYHQGYRFSEMVEFMRKSGFRLFSILEVCYADGQVEPHFADVVFKSE